MIGRNIKIYLSDATSSGIWHSEIINWTGQALSVPRRCGAELSNWSGYYHPSGGEWFACSKNLPLIKSESLNSIAYYMTGNEHSVKTLKLTLGVYNCEEKEYLLRQFIISASMLISKALNSSLSKEITQAISGCKDYVMVDDIYTLELKKNKLLVKGSFDYSLTVSVFE